MIVLVAASHLDQLDKRITDLGTTAALSLALLTVFTAARVEALRRRPRETGLTKWDFVGGAAVDWGLALVTAATTLAVLPIFVDAVSHLALGHERGVLRVVFVLIWLLLVFLFSWQVLIAVRSSRLAQKQWDHARAAPRDAH